MDGGRREIERLRIGAAEGRREQDAAVTRYSEEQRKASLLLREAEEAAAREKRKAAALQIKNEVYQKEAAELQQRGPKGTDSSAVANISKQMSWFSRELESSQQQARQQVRPRGLGRLTRWADSVGSLGRLTRSADSVALTRSSDSVV